MKITRISVQNYRGISARDIEEVPASGFTAAGKNGGGKTSIIKALRAALDAQDIGADAIRQGADKAEILINLDALSVRRVITKKTSSLTVKQGEMLAAKPQTYLTELLGTTTLDPLDLFLGKPKERRAKILEALPVTATLAMLREFAPELPDDFDVSGHGLEVLERARKIFYDRRTEANRKAADAKRTHADALAAADAAAKAAPDDGTNVAGALLEHEESKAALAAVKARQTEAAASVVRMEGTRTRITGLVSKAEEVLATRPQLAPDQSLPELTAACEASDGAVEKLRAALTAAEAQHRAALEALENARLIDARSRNALDEAESLRAQARQLEEAMEAAAPAPTEDEVIALQERARVAKESVERARAIQEARVLFATAQDAAAAHKGAQEAAAKLDVVVTTLTERAPTALLATVDGGFPGLSITPDDVLLDGKTLNALSGREQLLLAIDIARRLNAKAKILVVDGLERLDPDQIDDFVRYATRDGFQLIGTRVERGEVRIEAIEPEGAEAAE